MSGSEIPLNNGFNFSSPLDNMDDMDIFMVPFYEERLSLGKRYDKLSSRFF